MRESLGAPPFASAPLEVHVGVHNGVRVVVPLRRTRRPVVAEGGVDVVVLLLAIRVADALAEDAPRVARVVQRVEEAGVGRRQRRQLVGVQLAHREAERVERVVIGLVQPRVGRRRRRRVVAHDDDRRDARRARRRRLDQLPSPHEHCLKHIFSLSSIGQVMVYQNAIIRPETF